MSVFLARLSLSFLALAALLPAESRIHLKARQDASITSGQQAGFHLAAPARRLLHDRSHFIVLFPETPQPEQIEELRRRGAKVLQYVPDSGLMLSAGDHFYLEGLGLQWAGRLQAKDKISPLLMDEQGQLAGEFFLVEFFPDVEPSQARWLLTRHSLEISDHPDLLPAHFLVRGPAAQIAVLAEWDEVSYVFPASGDLIEGSPVHACAGAITEHGPVGQYIVKIGEGWDGPGRNSAVLGYFFEQFTEKLPEDATRAEILRALAEWTAHVSVSLVPAAAPNSPRTLNILFAPRNHGDPFPFDGPSGVLAHTYYPAPPNAEPIGGDIHLDGEEEWVIGPSITHRSVDLFAVMLHEIGHALGLGHSDAPGTVMYPFYRRVAALTPDDIAAIQELYAAAGTEPPEEPDGGPPPPPEPMSLAIDNASEFPLTTTLDAVSISGTVAGGSGEIQVAWSSNRGPAGAAEGGRTWRIARIPLEAGNNVVTITAADATSASVWRSVFITRQVAKTPPEIRITSPTSGSSYAAASPSLVVSGTASHSSGIERVEWTNSRGGRGIASGTTSWTTGPIALQAGSNTLTVTAYDRAGGSASRSLLVTYEQKTENDTVAPYLHINSPSSSNVLTVSGTIALRGTATDNVGVVQVAWTTSTEKSGVATGTTYWATPDIPLLVGTNRIIIRARDAAGNEGWRSITVTRR